MGEARRRAATGAEPWGAWGPGALPELTVETLRAHARHAGDPIADDTAALERQLALIRQERICVNRLYQVNIRDCGDAGGAVPHLLHLSVKRRDKAPLGKEHFRHLQRIKNELVGPECEAVELYPAESRLVDTANQYHLWVFAVPGYRLPFGYGERLVMGSSGVGAVQEPFEAEAAE